MLLATAPMDPTLQFVFFLVAVILFVVATLVPRAWLVPLGLAFATAVFAWNALAAT